MTPIVTVSAAISSTPSANTGLATRNEIASPDFSSFEVIDCVVSSSTTVPSRIFIENESGSSQPKGLIFSSAHSKDIAFTCIHSKYRPLLLVSPTAFSRRIGLKKFDRFIFFSPSLSQVALVNRDSGSRQRSGLPELFAGLAQITQEVPLLGIRSLNQFVIARLRFDPIHAVAIH